MFLTKYAGDYKLDENDPKGRKTVYCGKYYSIDENTEDRKLRIIFLWCFTLVATIAFILSLSFPNSLARLFFVVVPFSFNALTLYSAWASVIKYSFNKKERLERKEKEEMLDRMKSASLVGFIICLFSFGASIVAAALKLFSFGSLEIGFLTGLVLVLVSFFGVNALSRAIKVNEVENKI